MVPFSMAKTPLTGPILYDHTQGGAKEGVKPGEAKKEARKEAKQVKAQ